MKRYLLFVLSSLLSFLAVNALSQQKVVTQPDLSQPEGIKKWDLDGSGTWIISGNKLILSKAGVPSGPIRRPAALAILRTKPFRHVTIEAEIRCTAPVDTVRRDLDVVVGYESPTRFYYIHLSGASDDVHNGIFLVNSANRVRIDAGGGKPQLRDLKWHNVRVVRDGEKGHIAVYVDKGKAPVLEATDTTIPVGRAGFGSFDDTGEFRRIKVSGISTEPRE